MDTANRPGRGLNSNDHHVVDWQLVVTVDTERRDVAERIRVLEARALSLLRAATTSPGSAAAQRSLTALEAEITRLRSDLAWRRAEAHAARGGSELRDF